MTRQEMADRTGVAQKTVSNAMRVAVSVRLVEACRYFAASHRDLVDAVFAGTVKATAAEAEARRAGGCENARVTTSPAERKAAAREAAHRREAVRALQLGGQVCAYAAGVLGNGAAPEQAREAAVEAAGELALLAAELRRLTRLRGPARRSLARQLAARGVTRREIAIRCGVSESCVWGYLHRLDAR